MRETQQRKHTIKKETDGVPLLREREHTYIHTHLIKKKKITPPNIGEKKNRRSVRTNYILPKNLATLVITFVLLFTTSLGYILCMCVL